MSNRDYFADFLLDELWQAYLTARKGKRTTVDEHRFELNAIENIIDLRDCLLRRYYEPSRGVAFIVQDPVIREIVAAPFRDRVIHHFLYNICADWWDRRFLADSYSCRRGKGTLYGQKRLARHIRQATNNYTEPAFAIKLDIQGYFMSLNHRKLYERVLWGLDQQFFHSPHSDHENNIRCRTADREKLYKLLQYTWREIIFDDPMRNITIRGQRSDWRNLPSNKSLFNQPKGRGIVIGNLTSQLLSNIFLDQLDRFVTFDLGYRHYGRYVDDFFIVVPLPQKAQLLRDIEVIRKYLYYELGLTLHPKKQYRQTVDKGVPFIGVVVYPGYITPGKRSRANFYRAAYKMATNGEGDLDGIVSRIGHMKHINSRRFIHKLFDDFGWDYEPPLAEQIPPAERAQAPPPEGYVRSRRHRSFRSKPHFTKIAPKAPQKPSKPARAKRANPLLQLSLLDPSTGPETA